MMAGEMRLNKHRRDSPDDPRFWTPEGLASAHLPGSAAASHSRRQARPCVTRAANRSTLER